MKKELAAICSALFLLVTGAYISGTLLVPYTRSLGGSSLAIGVIYASMYVVRLVLGGPIGRMSQRRGAKTILKYSLILYPFIAVAYYVSFDIPTLLTARLLHGLASAMMLPMAMAYMGEISPPGKEGQYMGIYHTILFTGSAIGPAVGGTIYDRFGIGPAFFMLFCLALLSLAIIFFLAEDRNQGTKQKHAEEMKNATMKLSEAFRLDGMASLCLMQIAQAVLFALMGASLTQLALSHGLDMGTIGLLIALNNIIIGAIQIPLGKMADRFHKLKIAVLSGIGITLLLFVLPAAKNAVSLVLVLTTLGLFTAMNVSSVTALSAVFGKESGMSVIMGFLGSANSLGTIIGYLALGGITDRLGIHSTFYFVGVLFPMVLFLFGRKWWRFSTKDRLGEQVS